LYKFFIVINIGKQEQDDVGTLAGFRFGWFHFLLCTEQKTGLVLVI